MVTIFIKQNGDFFVEMLPHRTTFTGDYFREVIIPQIYQLAFPNKITRSTKKALLHFDNVPSHKEHRAMETLNDCPFHLLLNPPYSPDIAPLDFGVFGTIKEMMPPESSESEEELKETIIEILHQLGKGFINKVFLAWKERLRKVIESKGLYIK